MISIESQLGEKKSEDLEDQTYASFNFQLHPCLPPGFTSGHWGALTMMMAKAVKISL